MIPSFTVFNPSWACRLLNQGIPAVNIPAAAIVENALIKSLLLLSI
jgi:hypothetical protein